MKLLLDFFHDELFSNTEHIKLQHRVYKEFEHLVTSCFVIQNSNLIEIPQFSYRLSHKESIEKCIVFLIQNKLFNNVLCYGYDLGKGNQVNKILHCNSTNGNALDIKGPVWELLGNIIGREKFINLLINCSVFQHNRGTFIQIIGNKFNRPYSIASELQKERSEKVTFPVTFTNKSFLHKRSHASPKFNFLAPDDKIGALRSSIFALNQTKLSKELKKGVDKILNRILKNNCKNINYYIILRKICSKNEIERHSHLDFQIAKENVLKMVILVLEKLIPQEAYGSKRNKSVIFSKIPLLLSLPLNGSLPAETIFENVRSRNLYWLTGKQHDFSLKTHLRTCMMFKQFLLWLFRNLIPRIIIRFFYCTEVSSSLNIIYFTHDQWKKLTRPFLDQYMQRYLKENTLCRNHSSYIFSHYNHSRLRIVPKKAKGEFRIIAVQTKGSDYEEHTKYKANHKNFVLPVQQVLQYLRNKRKTMFPKVYSSSQIPTYISSFKKTLLLKYKTVPMLYFIKFDIASCYDSILRKKLISILQRLMKHENGFFIRSCTVCNIKSKSLRTNYYVNEAPRLGKDEIYVDNIWTRYLSCDDIFNILQTELLNTALWYGDKCYLRKDGLSQGASLSALLVDIFYDDLLENYEAFKTKSGQETLILKLADDFLVISTDRYQIADINALSLIGFEEYNAHTKAEKNMTSDSSSQEIATIQFCALHISIKSLEVWKHLDYLNVTVINSKSTAKIFAQLQTIFEMRLSFNTLSDEINSAETILLQITHISRNIAEIFLTSFKERMPNLGTFNKFLESLIASVVTHSKISDNRDIFEDNARFIITSTFFKTLLTSPSSSKNMITHLGGHLELGLEWNPTKIVKNDET
ncbi:hypothetical protein KAFR_0A06610 [Kazachstania africana CBS 2517]|uniref:Telomerase reverse transcriptase n=1 Tax=Kazachstania africana (strain ATCC 22294 / BCRC 22015 / CBS 2517 / CECT 1963 / NBRC 1671 / NRRL Y-8276) TaxID=1071382 RepID=H2ANZ6_KAZAF|nr:hypothetical protein KAFR_0A06610 [Kazachstania africana CBS 2517]CCF56096.1 hypothetical protein KAFR_0A06610 [Kazachstania africana CBS 2517]